MCSENSPVVIIVGGGGGIGSVVAHKMAVRDCRVVIWSVIWSGSKVPSQGRKHALHDLRTRKTLAEGIRRRAITPKSSAPLLCCVRSRDTAIQSRETSQYKFGRQAQRSLAEFFT